jgi:hypothetical protein
MAIKQLLLSFLKRKMQEIINDIQKQQRQEQQSIPLEGEIQSMYS